MEHYKEIRERFKKEFGEIKRHHEGVPFFAVDISDEIADFFLQAYREKGEKLTRAYGEYVSFLEEDINSNAVFLNIHGIVTKDEEIKKGERLRKKIRLLTSGGNEKELTKEQ